MEHATILCAEVRGDVASLLLTADNLKRPDLLKSRHKVLVEVFANLRIIQSVHTERFGVVSRVFAGFKVA